MTTGTITMHGKVETPYGYLFCDGSAVSRATYATLFSVIGVAFGVGDGSTTFNLPDLRGRGIFGFKSTNTAFDVMGETGGQSTINIAHSHSFTSHTHSGVSGTTGTPSGVYSKRTDYQLYASSAGHTHTITAGTVGNSSDNGSNSQLSTTQSVMNKYVVAYPLIKI